MSVQLILHPANQGPKLLLMPSLPKCSVRVRSFDRQRMKSSVCWLRVVIWIMLLRPWIDPMKLTKQHPFPSVTALLSQRQRQRVPQRLLRPICGASRSALGQQVLAVYIKFSTTPTWAPHLFQPIKINYMIVVISCPGMLSLPCIVKKDVGSIGVQSCTWSFARSKSMTPFCYRKSKWPTHALGPLWKLVVATREGHPET